MTQHYISLLQEISRIHGGSDLEEMTHGAQLVIHGVTVTLIPGEGADSLLLFCDFGRPPRQSRAEVLQRILETNLFMFSPESPFFSMDNETGHLLLMERMRASTVTAEVLLEKLERYAQHALRWGAGFILFDIDANPESSRGFSELNSLVDSMAAMAGGKKHLM
ncbi:CesT family type III secretion system chaperone [Noviherbaspirillum saxi]|uniref:Molecular chaperone Tir n=1 Tax=Noviherbaspirillum saxi TaxID=2320863 RepID=A0A3A3FLD9_9BURK|nr:CesT family type III secretion system chaperone [Noviherbaspirillum saxi]RJF92175.1 molecular chaperone Tir [Noviherbaspirillum saxi]